MPTHLETLISEALSSARRSAFGEAAEPPDATLRPTDRPEHGDFASNLPLVAAKAFGKPPREIAEALAAALTREGEDVGFRRIDVAGPGFLNFFLHPRAIHSSLSSLLAMAERYGRSELGEGRRIQVEFVSSNPTGPLTVGHGRQAILGDVLANLYDRIGCTVEREYYFNDEGRQIDLLAESLWARYRELSGETHEIPEDGYRGEYLTDVAEDVRAEIGDGHEAFDDEMRDLFRRQAVTRMTERIKDDLEKLAVRFDHWFSEATLHQRGEVDEALTALREHGGTYNADGAEWLAAEAHGGAKDSVLIRSDGRPTYLMVDIAYHLDKRRRGFDRVINVQGADHHTEQSCMKAAMRLLGCEEDWLQYAVHQFVSLKEGGETLKMSTRAGRFVTLHGLLEELGGDIVRWFMISRKPEAHLDFDLDLARSESQDNPATYVQYAHTRIASIFRNPENPLSQADVDWTAIDLLPLAEPEELDLIKSLDRFPAVVEMAAETFAPHLVADYALQLSRAFHAYYDKHRVLGEGEALTKARLALLYGLKTVLRESLAILGMRAPEEM
jgi:arginyl-tRNA synthetase